LPPTLAGCVQRNAIPAKIELEDEEGERISPEKADHAAFGELSDSERSSLFALSQWCGGKISSFVQLNLTQAGELLKLLHEVSCFYPANDPDQAIEWANGELLGVSDFIPLPETERPRPVREIKDEPEDEPVFNESEYEGPPIEVEGSTEYLRLILPSTEHPGYKEVLHLMREWNFLRDRNHRHIKKNSNSTTKLNSPTTFANSLPPSSEPNCEPSPASRTRTERKSKYASKLEMSPPTNLSMPLPLVRIMSATITKSICSPATYLTKPQKSSDESLATPTPSSSPEPATR